MFTVLVSLADPALRDLVRTGIRSFPDLRAVPVPRDELPRLVQDPRVSALICDWQFDRNQEDSLLRKLRELNDQVEILVAGRRPDRDSFHKTKVDLRVQSFIPLPLDAFDLARRLHRLSYALATAS
jgi:hypothetical protein